MESEYVEQRNGGYYVRGTRISLDSVIWAFRRGDSPETIRENFQLLPLAKIYGAIAFYLEHQAAIDAYIEEEERNFTQGTVPLREVQPELWEKLERARQQMGKRPA